MRKTSKGAPILSLIKRDGDNEVDHIEDIEDIDPQAVTFIKYSYPPKLVHCHFGSYDCVGSIWWEYDSKAEDEVISWEVRRYRLDVISKSYLQKGAQSYKDTGTNPRKFILFDLENGHHYKFTVSAVNAHGHGKESKLTHSIYVDLPLPNGWFRAPSPAGDHSFLFYNLKTQASSVTRPDSHPLFIEDEAVVKAFSPQEINHLTSLWNEEILHFEKMTKARVQIILWELGYDFTSREVALLVREYSRKSSECLYEYRDFLEVMFSCKTKAIKDLLITEKIAKVGRYLLCFSRGEAARPASLIERVGDWEIRRSKNNGRFFSYHRGRDEKHWFLPLEARLFISPEATVEEEAQQLYDPTEMDLIRHLYCHLDIHSVGGINSVELYRYLYVASHPKPPPQPFLTPASLTERSAIFSVISTSALPPPASSPETPFSGIRFAEFLRFCLLLKRNQSNEAQRFIDAFPALSKLNLTKTHLLVSIEAYLVARRDKKYEAPTTGKGIGSGGAMRTSPEVRISESDVNGVRRFSETEDPAGDMSWLGRRKEQGNQKMIAHPECCFCGCKAGRLG